MTPSPTCFLHRDRGFIPEGLLNYLALLGWGIADDRDIFTLDEMVAAFDISQGQLQPGAVRPEEGRRDQRRAHPAARAGRLRRAGCSAFLRRARPSRRPTWTTRVFADAPPIWCRRASWCSSDAWDLLKFLFVDEAEFALDRRRPRRTWRGRRTGARRRARGARTALDDWTTAAIEEALKAALVDGLGLKPRKAFAPVRVAVTGSHISPPLYESMELLGRDAIAGPAALGRAARQCAGQTAPVSADRAQLRPLTRRFGSWQ